jgi:hypothetical protein
LEQFLDTELGEDAQCKQNVKFLLWHLLQMALFAGASQFH